MASFRRLNTGYPDGTTVYVFDATGYPSGYPGSNPPGTAVAEAVASEGSVEFTGLVDDTPYFAAAKVDGVWRGFRFIAGADGTPLGAVEVFDGTAFQPQTKTLLDARDWVGYSASTSDRGPQLQEALDAARDAGGGVVILPPWTIYTGQTLVTYSLVHLRGHGYGTSIIKLLDGADCDVVTVDEYGAGGIHQGSWQDFKVDGNKANNSSGSGILSDGVSLLGRDLLVQNCAKDGINHTQSREPNTARTLGEDDSLFQNVKALDCEGRGIRNNAHDCHFVDVWSCSNAERNFLVDDEGYATKLTRVHAFGAAEYGFEFRASYKAIECEAEGATKAQLLLNADNGHWDGHVFADSDPKEGDGKIGIEWGAGAGYNTIIEGRITGCTNGSLKFTGTGSNSVIRALIDQASGEVIAPSGGEPGSNVDFSGLQFIGNAKLNLPVKTVASAKTIAIPSSARVIEITGKTTIEEIEGFKPNQIVTLRFREALTVKSGLNIPIKGDFKARPGDTLTLAFGKSEWSEAGRAAREGGTMYGPAPLVGTPASGAAPAGSNYETVKVTLPNRATLTGVALRVGAEKAGNVRVYLHDAAGNLLAHSSSTAMGEKEQWQRVAFEDATTVEAGDYFLSVQYSTVNCKIFKARMLAPTKTAAGPAEFSLMGKIEPPTTPENTDRPILMTY